MFDDITNAICKMIAEDVDITAYCVDKLGSALNSQDNSIVQEQYLPQIPFFIVNKQTETHFYNRAVESGTSKSFPFYITFVGGFSVEQDSDDSFDLPDGAKETINGVTTFTPSDTMRIVARMVGELINKNIECISSGFLLESYSVDAETYYGDEDGSVASVLEVSIYKSKTWN